MADAWRGLLVSELMREEFEKWVTDGGKWPQLTERSGDYYTRMDTHLYWRAWRAASNGYLKDAERYRFLRAEDRPGDEENSAYVCTDDQSAFTGDRLDLLIDSSMAKLKAPK
jgi:hypothetical protein